MSAPCCVRAFVEGQRSGAMEASGLRYLVRGQNVRQEVAAAGPQQVHLLADVVLQLVKAGFGRAHLSLNLR